MIAAISSKRLIVTIIIFGITGIATGMLFGGNFNPAKAPQYAEKPVSIKTETVVMYHSHDGLPTHKHVAKVKTTVLETTPHGYFHDFDQPLPQSVPQSTPDTTQPVQTPEPTPQNITGAGVPHVDEAAHQPVANTTQTTNTPREYEVWLYYDAVVPIRMTIPVGGKVTWINKDPTQEHTVHSDNIGGPLSFILSPGRSISYTFTEAGRYAYHCEPHPHLVGEIIVQ